MKISIPEKLDLDWLEKEARAKEHIKPYKTDKLAYIVSLIVKGLASRRDYLYDDGFVPLDSTLMQKYVKNYKQYLNFLVAAGIIEINHHFTDGKAKKYRLLPAYSFGVKRHKIEDWTLISALEKYYEECKRKNAEKYGHLQSWLNGKLCIDEEAAMAFCREDYNIKTVCPELRDKKRKRRKYVYIHPDKQFSCSQMHIQSFKDGDISDFTVDDNGYRFHSILTNMNSSLRHALTYDGKQLVSLDIKNSQPYFSTLLLTEEFWKKKVFEPKYKNLYRRIYHNNKYHSPSIMLSEISAILTGQDIQRYRQLVFSGSFYEEFRDEYNRRYATNKDRDDIKHEVLILFFSSNDYRSKAKTLFRELFPSVHRLFSLIKEEKHNTLSLLLQRIESEMVLDHICELIHQERPEMYLSTIHDSIITTVEHQDYLRETMLKTLKNAIGEPPNIKPEVWCVDNLRKETETLQELCSKKIEELYWKEMEALYYIELMSAA